jgi:hypothetical protein
MFYIYFHYPLPPHRYKSPYPPPPTVGCYDLNSLMDFLFPLHCKWRANEYQIKCLVFIFVFPEMKLLFPKQNYNDLSPSSYTHISVRYLYISMVCLFWYREICRLILGIYKSLIDTWMNHSKQVCLQLVNAWRWRWMYTVSRASCIWQIENGSCEAGPNSKFWWSFIAWMVLSQSVELMTDNVLLHCIRPMKLK